MARTIRTDNHKSYCDGQGGWDDDTWGGVERRYFIFRDSLRVGACIYYSDTEGTIHTDDTAAELQHYPPREHFAGIFCVADE